MERLEAPATSEMTAQIQLPQLLGMGQGASTAGTLPAPPSMAHHHSFPDCSLNSQQPTMVCYYSTFSRDKTASPNSSRCVREEWRCRRSRGEGHPRPPPWQRPPLRPDLLWLTPPPILSASCHFSHPLSDKLVAMGSWMPASWVIGYPPAA